MLYLAMVYVEGSDLRELLRSEDGWIRSGLSRSSSRLRKHSTRHTRLASSTAT